MSGFFVIIGKKVRGIDVDNCISSINLIGNHWVNSYNNKVDVLLGYSYR